MDHRTIAVIGAPSAIGIRPYDNRGEQEVKKAPSVLRDRGIIIQLGAVDYGDVIPPKYHDFVMPKNKVRNMQAVKMYSLQIAKKIEIAGENNNFVLLLGGECSITLGAVLGARKLARKKVGLVYIDAHADFASPNNTTTGSVSGMCLTFLIGRGNTSLDRLIENEPLCNQTDIVIVGRRDEDEVEEVLKNRILEISDEKLRTESFTNNINTILSHVTENDLGGFWIHLDVDVIDPKVFPALYVQTPNGLSLHLIGEILKKLVNHPKAIGMHVALYDPKYDQNNTCADLLVKTLRDALK